MIAWVYENARQAACLDHLLVATDSPEIEFYCREHGIPALIDFARTQVGDGSPGGSHGKGAGRNLRQYPGR